MRKLLLFVLLAIPLAASPQNPSYNSQVLSNVNGFAKIVPGATVTVCAVSGGQTICGSPIATTVADGNGNFKISTIQAGTYDIFISGTGITTYKYTQTISP